MAYKGDLADTVYQLCGGIRSGMGYCGCPTIQELKEKAVFVRITNNSAKSHSFRGGMDSTFFII